MPNNVLYLAVLPLVHISKNQPFGLTEETLTLFPDRNFATQFRQEEVEGFITTFRNRADKYLTGGDVISYTFTPIDVGDGRMIVEVMQNVR
jgi:hypothetical protein